MNLLSRTLFLLTFALLPARTLALNSQEARHLLLRTGFHAAPEDMERFQAFSRSQAVEYILGRVNTKAQIPPPDLVHKNPPAPKSMKGLPQAMRKARRKERNEEGRLLKEWWYQEMLHTNSPFTERMTLFWHNHFTSGMRKARWAPLMYFQNVLLRKHALGNFGTLLHEIAKDPAMVIYLDNARNRKGKPNENFAREVMELFTLGEGNYTEKDIKEAARAKTGWGIHRPTAKFRFRKRQYDPGQKTVLGKTGFLSGEQVLDHLLAQPACARWLTQKLWKELVSPELPAAAEIERLAQVLRSSQYEIKPWVKAVLLSPGFWAERNRGVRIKSPVELMVGTLRLLNQKDFETRPLMRAGKQLGQDLFEPPNVKGWPGGKRWITASTLLQRGQLLRKFLRGMQESPEVAKLAKLDQDALIQRVMPIAPVNPIPKRMKGFQLLHHLILDPAYQLQ